MISSQFVPLEPLDLTDKAVSSIEVREMRLELVVVAIPVLQVTKGLDRLDPMVMLDL